MTSPGGSFLEGILGGFGAGAEFRMTRDDRKRRAQLDEEERTRRATEDARAAYWDAMQRAEFEDQSGYRMAPTESPDYVGRFDENIGQRATNLRSRVGARLTATPQAGMDPDLGPRPNTRQIVTGGIVRGESEADRANMQEAEIAAKVGTALTREAGVADRYSPEEQTLIGMGRLPMTDPGTDQTAALEFYTSRYPDLQGLPPDELLRLGREYEQDRLIRDRQRDGGTTPDFRYGDVDRAREYLKEVAGEWRDIVGITGNPTGEREFVGWKIPLSEVERIARGLADGSITPKEMDQLMPPGPAGLPVAKPIEVPPPERMEAQRAWDANARQFGRAQWEAVAGPRP